MKLRVHLRMGFICGQIYFELDQSSGYVFQYWNISDIDQEDSRSDQGGGIHASSKANTNQLNDAISNEGLEREHSGKTLHQALLPATSPNIRAFVFLWCGLGLPNDCRLQDFRRHRQTTRALVKR